MKLFFKTISLLGLGALLLSGCKNKEAELLTPKLYFETVENVIKVGEGETMDVELKVRLSQKSTNDVNVTYSIGNQSLADAFNARYGKEYKYFNPENVAISSDKSSIKSGSIYSEKVELEFSNLGEVAMGEKYIVPICVKTNDTDIIDDADIAYFILDKPVQIKQVAKFNDSHITLDLTPLDKFSEVTYEAIVCVDRFGANNTVMGCEGVMIMRIGDAGGGTVPKDILQMSGKSEITWTGNPIQPKKWYHLAFTNTSDGKAKLFVNGEPVIEGSFTMSEDLTAGGDNSYGFSIGKVPGFMWGTRPFYGWMTEVRLWNVARTPAQIKENMLNVDPKSPGLVAYFKLDGAVKNYAEGGKPAKVAYNVRHEPIAKPVVIGDSIY